MLVNGKPTRSLWAADTGEAVFVIDQRALPHALKIERLATPQAVRTAIADMWVRGAPLIGASAAFGIALQARRDGTDAALLQIADELKAARPTAVNLRWAVDRMLRVLRERPLHDRAAVAWAEAQAIADGDVADNQALGEHGSELIADMAKQKRRRLNLLTHCNAGWLATVDWGTALAPIYKAHAAAIDVHVWVDETRPRNQGAALTAWELAQQGVAHTLVADNAGGHLMQRGLVDMVIVGCDRVSAQGDVCNKIGTYLKALAARAHDVPFYVAMPLSTLDPLAHDALRNIPIEERSAREVTHVSGRGADGRCIEVQLAPDGCAAANPAFDVTPAALVSALITEHGVVAARPDALVAIAARSGHRDA